MGLFFEMHKKMDKDLVRSTTQKDKNIDINEPNSKV
jgi:hypothetical protein